MSLRIGSPRLEATQTEPHKVYSADQNASEQLENTVCKLGEYIFENCPDPGSITFLKEVLHDVSASYGKVEDLYVDIVKFEKETSLNKGEAVSRKRHFEPSEDQSPARKKLSSSRFSGSTSKKEPDTFVNLAHGLRMAEASSLTTQAEGLNLSLANDCAELEGIDTSDFKMAAKIQPNDSPATQIQKCFHYLNKRRGYLELAPISVSETFADYKKGYEEMEKKNCLHFWIKTIGTVILHYELYSRLLKGNYDLFKAHQNLEVAAPQNEEEFSQRLKEIDLKTFKADKQPLWIANP